MKKPNKGKQWKLAMKQLEVGKDRSKSKTRREKKK